MGVESEKSPEVSNTKRPKIGVVDVGGGLRDIFGAGVFDRCIDEDIWFDYAIGVSAGSANLVSYLAGQRARAYEFYINYAFRPEYMGMRNFLRSGSYVDLDYIYGTLSGSQGENPLDYEAFLNRATPFDVVATNAETGQPIYLSSELMSQDDYGAIKASCCVPGVNKPYVWRGDSYYDGGMSDPIPFRKAFEAGCEKVVVVLTRPKAYRREAKADDLTVALIKHRHPQAAETMRHRAELYNRQLDDLLELEAEGKALVLAPQAEDVDQLHTLTKDHDLMQALYERGYDTAFAIRDFVGQCFPSF